MKELVSRSGILHSHVALNLQDTTRRAAIKPKHWGNPVAKPCAWPKARPIASRRPLG